MSRKVSIIVPFYNTQIAYYQKCLNSICDQTYKNLEIIIVDDGSQDELAKVIDTLSKQDVRIKVFHKSNGGVSSARNLGIKEATGDYIAFVDSDDWVEPIFIETLVSCLETYDAQIASVGVIEEYNNIVSKVEGLDVDMHPMQQQELYAALLTRSSDVLGYLCNKLYRKKLIIQLLNESYHYCEDLVFNAYYLKQVHVGVVASVKLYHYRLGDGNATRNFKYNPKILTLIEAYSEVERIFSEECPQKIDFIRLAILKQALNIRARYKISNANNIEQYNYCKSIIKTYWDACKHVSTYEKINIYLTFLFPKLLFKIKQFILNIKNR